MDICTFTLAHSPYTCLTFLPIGLRPGTRIKVFNASQMHVNGKLVGLVASFRTSVTILSFSTDHLSPCVRIHPNDMNLHQDVYSQYSVPHTWWCLNALSYIKTLHPDLSIPHILTQVLLPRMQPISRTPVDEFFLGPEQGVCPPGLCYQPYTDVQLLVFRRKQQVPPQVVVALPFPAEMFSLASLSGVLGLAQKRYVHKVVGI